MAIEFFEFAVLLLLALILFSVAAACNTLDQIAKHTELLSKAEREAEAYRRRSEFGL
jgi:hypothetical protein